MTVLRDFSIMYASMFSLVVFMTLFESRLSKKKTVTLTLTLMVPLMIANFVLMFIVGIEKMNTLVLLTCSLPSLCFFWFIAKNRDGRFFFTFCFSDSLMLWIIDLTGVLDLFIGNSYLFMLISRLILCPVVAVVFGKWFRPMYINIQNKVTKGWWLFSSIVLLFYLQLSYSMSVPTHITQRLDQLPAFVMLLVLMPVIYIHIFTTLVHQIRTSELLEKEHILNLQVSNLRTRVEEFNELNHQAKIERHDFRHKMQAISVMIEKQQYDQLRELVQEYSDSVSGATLEQYCQHPVLDAVFASYLHRAKQNGIHVSLKLYFPEDLPVPEAELATVFANALDNAINACMKLPSCDRSIDITALTAPCFMFQIRNSYDGIVSINEEGIPVSAKKDHGFGTRSIVTFCNKYHMYYEFKVDDSTFALRVSLH